MNNDQAELLRQRIQAHEEGRETRVLAIVSGKGGVGKSNISLNFALSLRNDNKKVLLFDMDIGMGNLDVLMGKSSTYTIVDFFKRDIPLRQVISTCVNDVDYIAGGTGLSEVTKLSESAFTRFTSELETVLFNYDYVLFDMGAGMNEDALRFILSVQEIIVVTLPEPPAIMDAYAAIKHLHLLDPDLPLYLIVNRVQTEREGLETTRRISRVLKSFLGKDIISLGMVPDDRNVKQAVSQQVPLLQHNPRAPAARAINRMKENYLRHQSGEATTADPKHFIERLKELFFERKA